MMALVASRTTTLATVRPADFIIASLSVSPRRAGAFGSRGGAGGGGGGAGWASRSRGLGFGGAGSVCGMRERPQGPDAGGVSAVGGGVASYWPRRPGCGAGAASSCATWPLPARPVRTS